MASYVLLHLRYVVRPVSDHAEVSHNFRLSHTNHLLHTQGVCRDGEEPLDRLLSAFYEFRTGCFRDSCFDPFRVTSRYDLSPSPLNQTSETTQTSKAIEFTDPLFDEYWICVVPLWKNNEIIYLVLSLVYGAVFLPFINPSPNIQSLLCQRRLGPGYRRVFREMS